MVTVRIDGKPQAWQRAKPFFNKASNFMSQYTPVETVNYQNLVKLSYQRATEMFFEGAVRLIVLVCLKPPQSASKKKYAQMLNGEILPSKRPDWDNLGKQISDALNGIAYNDDSQITYAVVIKRYAEKDYLEFTLTEDKLTMEEILER